MQFIDVYSRCSDISTRRFPFICRDTRIRPLISNFISILFNSRKLTSSFPFFISRRRSSSVKGPFRSMTSMTESRIGLGPQTLSKEILAPLRYRSWRGSSLSSQSLGEFLIPSIVFRRYTRTNAFHCFVKISSRHFDCFYIIPE